MTALSTGMLLARGLRSSDVRHRYLHRLTLRAAPLQTALGALAPSPAQMPRMSRVPSTVTAITT